MKDLIKKGIFFAGLVGSFILIIILMRYEYSFIGLAVLLMFYIAGYCLVILAWWADIFKIENGIPRWYYKLILIVCVGVLIMIYQPVFYSKMQLVKNIVLFVYVSVVVIYLTFRYYRYQKLKWENTDISISTSKRRLLKGFVIILTICLIGLFSQVERYFINNYIIPPLYGCSYYDDYNNLIYDSQFAETCPELKNVIIKELDDGHSLTFTVEEKVETDYSRKYKFTIDSQVEYVYDQNNRVTNYTISSYYKWYWSLEKDTELILKDVIYFKQETETTYQDQEVHSTIKQYSNQLFHNKLEELDSIEQVEPVIYEYRSTITENTEKEKHWKYNIDVDYKDGYRDEFVELYDAKYSSYNYLNVKFAGTLDEVNIGTYNGISRDFQTTSFEKAKRIQVDHYNLKRLFNQGTIMLKGDHNGDLRVNYYEDDRIELRSNSSKDFNNFTSRFMKKNYGYKVEHYRYERGSRYQFIEGSVIMPNGMKTNRFAVDLKALNTQSFTYHPHDEHKQLIYQTNPLLFEQELLLGDKEFKLENEK